MHCTAPTLCEGVFLSHLSKSSSCFLSSRSTLFRRRKPGLVCNSGYLEEKPWSMYRYRKLVEKYREVSTSAAHDNHFRYIENKSDLRRLGFFEQIFGNLDKARSRINGERVSTTLSFLVLLGFITLQCSQEANAATELISGTGTIPFLGNLGDISTGFASAFLLIFFSELGDKTFFIAALLAARNSGAVVFIGTFLALATMTLISVALGRTFHYVDGILPFKFGTDLPVDDIAAVCLLVYFGVTTLIDAFSDDSSKATEEKEEAELAISELSGNGAGIMAATNTVISTFLLVFVAEWGDKSFFSTISLAAATSPLGVIAGALAGHAVATMLAVVGGSLLESFFSEKVISYIGGTLFLVFAAVTLKEIVN